MEVATATSVSEFVGTWFLVSVKPQHELRMARELTAKGVQNFLPLERVEKTGTRKNGKIYKRVYDRIAWTGYSVRLRRSRRGIRCTGLALEHPYPSHPAGGKDGGVLNRLRE